jgi:uncharacterized membrane protein/thiol-disulfide isomerase/thioredoxin
MLRIQKKVLFTLALAILFLSKPVTSLAQNSIVYAVFFFSPSCGHCHKVIEEDLPPLLEKYAGQLVIVGIDVSIPEGQKLYRATVDEFGIPDERLGVPTLVVGETVLVGSLEIPQQLPGIIEAGLASGGIDWPNIPGLDTAIPEYLEPSAQENPSNLDTTPKSSDSLITSFSNKFLLDPTGNLISVITLLAMLASVIAIIILLFSNDLAKPPLWPRWVIPAAVILGLFVAGYMAYIELTQSEAVCGPVGDCNAVQQSPYAVLFGILPIGMLGIVGYLLIGALWLVQEQGPEAWKRAAAVLIWGLVSFGVLFSIYLTFLEPFIIGATCAWCITSAILMTILLWASSGSAKRVWQSVR